MNTLKRWMGDRQITSLVVVLVAGLIMILTTACSPPEGPRASGNGSYDEKRGFQTELYDTTQPKQGGINGYNDDLQDSNPKVQAKVRTLVEGAKRNTARDMENPKDIPDKVQQAAEDTQDNISSRLERQKDNFVKGTERGVENLRNNLSKASKEVPEVIQDATDNAKTGIQQSVDSAKDTAATLKQNVDETVKPHLQNK